MTRVTMSTATARMWQRRKKATRRSTRSTAIARHRRLRRAKVRVTGNGTVRRASAVGWAVRARVRVVEGRGRVASPRARAVARVEADRVDRVETRRVRAAGRVHAAVTAAEEAGTTAAGV